MSHFKILATALGAALLVAACGGGGNGDQAPAVKYSSVVSFGDSLSDAGTYNVGSIHALGGGQFTVNGVAGAIGADPTPSYTWAQLISAAAVGSASCAARTGGFGIVESGLIAGCTDYAQGGSRVTAANGVGNTVGVGYIAGPLTEPVVTQVANYLSDTGGKFSGKELVTVHAGGNDIFGQTDILKTAATAAGTAAGTAAFGPYVANALATSTRTAQQIGAAMAAAQTAAAVPGATADSIQLAVILGAVHDSVANGGNTTVLDVGAVIVIAKFHATNPPEVGAAIAAAAAATPSVTLTPTQAGGQIFVNSLTTQLIADIPPANMAAAATAISGAFVAAKTAGASDDLATFAAVQRAADVGNLKVSAIIGTSNHAILGVVGNGKVYAGGVGAAAGATYAAGPGAQAAVSGMVTAAKQLVDSIKGMLASGATHILVVNLPDVSQTPLATGTITTTNGITDNSQQKLILGLTSAFNQALQDGLAGIPGVVFVDAFSENQRQMINPAHYALTNIKDVACNLNFGVNPLATSGVANSGSSLACKASNLNVGDTSHYLFADQVHPTPYGHKLLAQYVTQALVRAGWL